VADVAKELGLVEQTVYLWLRQERVDRGEQEGLSSSEREELAQLRKENRQLRQERDLLKKATAFWVRELDR
jgi:transposase